MMLFPDRKVEHGLCRIFDELFHSDNPLISYACHVYMLYRMTLSDKDEKGFLSCPFRPAWRSHIISSENLYYFRQIDCIIRNYLPSSVISNLKSLSTYVDVVNIEREHCVRLLQDFKFRYINQTGRLFEIPQDVVSFLVRQLDVNECDIVYNPYAGSAYFDKFFQAKHYFASEENELYWAITTMERIILGQEVSNYSFSKVKGHLKNYVKIDLQDNCSVDQYNRLITVLDDISFFRDNRSSEFFQEIIDRCHSSLDSFKAVISVPSSFLIDSQFSEIRSMILPVLEKVIELPGNLFYSTKKEMSVLVCSNGVEVQRVHLVDARKCVKEMLDGNSFDQSLLNDHDYLKDVISWKTIAENSHVLLPSFYPEVSNAPVGYILLKDVLTFVPQNSKGLFCQEGERAFIVSMDAHRTRVRQDAMQENRRPFKYASVDQSVILVSNYLGSGIMAAYCPVEPDNLLYYDDSLFFAYTFDSDLWDPDYLVNEIKSLPLLSKGKLLLDREVLESSAICLKSMEEQKQSKEIAENLMNMISTLKDDSATREEAIRRENEEDYDSIRKYLSEEFSTAYILSKILAQKADKYSELSELSRRLCDEMNQFNDSLIRYVKPIQFGEPLPLDFDEFLKNHEVPDTGLSFMYCPQDSSEIMLDGNISRHACIFVSMNDFMELLMRIESFFGKYKVEELTLITRISNQEKHVLFQFSAHIPEPENVLIKKERDESVEAHYLRRFTEHYKGTFDAQIEDNKEYAKMVLGIELPIIYK